MKFRLSLIIIFFVSLGYSQKIQLQKLEINSKNDHFSPFFNNEKVFFSSNNKDKRGRVIRDEKHGNSFGLFEAKFNSNNEIEDVVPLKIKGRILFNMSVSTMSKDGKYLYYTTNNRVLGQNKIRRKKTFNLQIQRAEYVEGKGWTNATTLPFCKSDFNYGHPALSPDGKMLYFVSNSKGTKGKTDIFRVSVANHSSYGEPEKLNNHINSSRTELYPFISLDNKLYFSSDRVGSMGRSYDIYVYDLNTKDKNEKPKALPKPLNTVAHDFSFFLMDDLKSGFITSRRYRTYGKTGEKGEGGDDIYYFTGF